MNFFYSICITIFLASCVAGDRVPALPVPQPLAPQSNETSIYSASRITKKPFGIYITRANSPVQPEKFSGYHTGTDFETFESEQGIDVPVSAICDGPLLQKRTASGYGGVAIQKCNLNSEEVTIVYGHLKYYSIKPNVGDALRENEEFAVLGEGAEADFERKHLHLSIHKGTQINIRGYVQTEKELGEWIDYSTK